MERAFAQIERVDVVVNNAGISYRTPALQIGRDQWDEVVGTNLTGVFQVAQAAARRMLPAGGGLIINVASTNALFGYPFYADYNATKAGVLALTRTLALEWAPTVRVVAVCPGYVLTPMQEAEYTPRDDGRGERPHPAAAARSPGGDRRPVRLPRLGRVSLLHGLVDRLRRRRDGRQLGGRRPTGGLTAV